MVYVTRRKNDQSRSVLSFDISIPVVAVLLMSIGVAFVYSSGVDAGGISRSSEYVRQIVFAGLGLFLLFGVAAIDYSTLRSLALYIYVGTLILLIVTLLFGRVVNGARSWIGIGPLGVQPSEFAKIGTIIFLAFFLEQNGKHIERLSIFGMALGIVMVPSLLVLIQPDLGTASVFVPIFLFMAFAAGAKPRHLLFMVLLAIVMVVVAVIPAWQELIAARRIPALAILIDERLQFIPLLTSAVLLAISGTAYLSTRKQYFYWIAFGSMILLLGIGAGYLARQVLQTYQIMRLIVFLDPQVDRLGAGWNIIQSVTAVGAGGLTGNGWLLGPQSHNGFIPQQSTDFIFSIISEEWGFLGAMLIFGLFMILFYRGLRIAKVARDRFSSLLAVGVTSMLFFHFAVNVGMAIGIMPITGIPLFFLSYGGSSLWTALAGLGVLMSIYQNRYQY